MKSIWAVVVIMLALGNGCNGCWEKERIALLQLKDSITSPVLVSSLPSWKEDNNMDCCHWEFVECNSTTHRVIKLSLKNPNPLFWRYPDDYWHLNASILLSFGSLRSLDLSGSKVRFVGDEGIGILRNLEELDLSNNYLDNSVLTSLNKLSNLKSLRLAGSIYVEEFDDLNNLKELDLSMNVITNISALISGIGILQKLEELDLSRNYLDNSVLTSLNKLSNLKSLRLVGNNLNGSLYVEEFDGLNNLKKLDLSFNRIASISARNGIGISPNLSNLEELDLTNNDLDNSVLLSLNKFSNLRFLNLTGNKLNGSISIKEFDGLNNLKELRLGENEITSISTALNGSQDESGILKKLEFLDLHGNDFDNSVWSFLGWLSSIKTLDLSFNTGLHGAVHNKGLCELKKLRELDISWSGFGGTLPSCLANLTSLRLLDITSNHFTGNIARSPLINMTSLEYLAISDNDFEVPISFKSFFNHSKLVFIESLNNTLEEEEDFVAASPSFQLIGLRLSNSKHGHTTQSLPCFLYHQHDLVLVELSAGVTGKFPYWLLDNNTRMETLRLSHNSFGGPLLLPSRPLRNLLVLDVSNNQLEDILPYKIASTFPSLEFLNTSTNNFEGNIPSSFGNMTAMQVLDLSKNRLSGEIPVHLAKGCRLLRLLILSNNSLKGPVLPKENNLTQLRFLYSDNNGFIEIMPSLSKSPLVALDVSANQLKGKIPGFIWNMSLMFLAMAGNHLKGRIPIEFCRLKELTFLDLSENYITGAVPSCFNSSSIQSIRLSKNMLDGPFPLAFNSSYSSLIELDLSYNQFSGTIPTWIGSLSHLQVLLLKNNQFEGNIPNELCHLSSLTLFDLSFNNLSGSIPHCIGNAEFNGLPLQNFAYFSLLDDSQYLFTLLLHDLKMVLDKSGRSQNWDFPLSAIGEEVKFTTKGMSWSYRGIVLSLFSGINLSHNRLTGCIPPEIGNLTHLKVLNLSHNNFIGTIPWTFSNLKSIECLDLSYNHLNGKIPSQLTELNFLAVFNLSFNNLSGRMPPRVKQFGTFESSSYVGNPFLCGEPLPRKCNATDSPPSMPRATVNETDEDSSFMDRDVFYMSFAGSYVTVVLAILAILLINPYWRRAWFHLVEVSLWSSYYFVVDNLVGRRRGFLWK